MYKLHFLKKENDLNKIIKSNKANRKPFTVLFVSLWDEYCNKLIDQLKEQYEGALCSESDMLQPLYIVDSYHMPHSFVIYNTTKLPHLVRVTNNKVQSLDYLSLVIDKLGLK
jgi:hypothetical protein